jgi:sulfite reductase (NADPH) flavoprotein alpha-component
MMEQSYVPCLPESAPFTPEQRAYLNGFFAGLFSRAPLPGSAGSVASEAEPKRLRLLTILFGSQTGNAEGLAKRAAKEAGKRDFAPAIFDLAEYPRDNLKTDQSVLLITSTYGDGEPPDNAKAFWDFLTSDAAPALPNLRFSVLSLGDSNYEKFCQCGKDFDRRFEALGARPVHPRADCDVDFEATFREWLNGALKGLAECRDADQDLSSAAVSPPLEPEQIPTHSPSGHPLPIGWGEGRGEGNGAGSDRQEIPAGTLTGYSRTAPFPSSVLTNRMLNGAGSAKETRHFEFSLEGSGLKYDVGDALGVLPANCPELVEDIISALGCKGDECVPGAGGQLVALRDALLSDYEVTKIPQPFLPAMAERSGDGQLRKLSEPGVNGELTKFLYGREIIDLLLAFPMVRLAPVEFVGLLKKLQPRLYSISSSQQENPDRVHLTVAIVRYESLGRGRKGVCSSFLADRTDPGRAVPIFVQANKGFRLPSDNSRPVIMIGPGTGVAPFRAFLQQRRAAGASGKNWLFFGDQHEKSDFLYRQELETLLRERTLAQLTTAFSRDQEQKLYVQQRMLEHAKEVYAWLEEGAHFYVCGDASRMAKDVDKALHQVIESASGRTAGQAAEYVAKLKAEKRYQRDVY